MAALKHWRAYVFLYGVSLSILALIFGELSAEGLATSAIAVGALIVLADIFRFGSREGARIEAGAIPSSNTTSEALGKRRESRRRTHFRTGRLQDVNGSKLPCTIVDRSPNGARVLLVLGPVEDLEVVSFYDEAERTWYRAEAAWQRGNELGLKLELR